MDTNALNRLISRAGGKDKVFVCAACGSINVSILAYVNVNYGLFTGYSTDPHTFHHMSCMCNQEKRLCYLMTLQEFEEKMREDMENLQTHHISLKKFDALSYNLKRKEWSKYFNVELKAK